MRKDESNLIEQMKIKGALAKDFIEDVEDLRKHMDKILEENSKLRKENARYSLTIDCLRIVINKP